MNLQSHKCKFAEEFSPKANKCLLNLYGGYPSKGVCSLCISQNKNNLGKMISSLANSTIEWAKNRFELVDKKIFNIRLETCKGCEFWDAAGMAGTGRCKKCGCSTQAKLRMATEKCPIGKW
jgi:hypothetical protein